MFETGTSGNCCPYLWHHFLQECSECVCHTESPHCSWWCIHSWQP